MRGDDGDDDGLDFKAFHPPEEDADELDRAAQGADEGAARLRDQSKAVHRGAAEALSCWSGPRRDLFARALVAVQVWLRAQERSTAEMAGILHAYAQAVRRTTREIEEYHRGFLRARQAKAEAEARVANSEFPYGLDPVFDPLHEARAGADLEEARAAQRQADQYLEWADDAHRELARRVRELVGSMENAVGLLVPGGFQLSPSDLAAHIHLMLGTGPVGGFASITGAFSLIEDIAATVPAGAVNLDGTVAWDVLARDPSVPRRGSDPIDVALWWSGLSVLQQTRVLEEQPTSLGNLDGLPAVVRDASNRAIIPAYRTKLESALAEASGDLVGQLQDKLRALDAVARVIAKSGRQLLVLDPFSGEQMHAAVGFGDADTAAHIGVLTPGLGSNVQDGLRSYGDQMARLNVLANTLSTTRGDGGAVATVAWLGYDAPQKSELVAWHDTVARSELAKTGGKALAGFLKGVTCARGEHQPLLVPLGHSYGSLTTAYALRHSDTGADATVLFGSPGPGTTRRSDVHVPAGYLYFAEADWDPVADADWFGTDPSHLDDVQRLQTDAANTPIGHLKGIHGHTSYLAEGTTSQYDIAAVVAGVDARWLVTTPLEDAHRPGGFPFRLFNPPSAGGTR